MAQIIDSGQASSSDPLTDAQNALLSAIDAATAFNGFVTQIEAFKETLTTQQDETLAQIESETASALDRITMAQNDAIREIHRAQRSETLDRPATHNPQSRRI